MPVSREEVTVLIPTLMEEEAIGLVLSELKSEGYTNILVVDGHSTDRTVEIARSMGVDVIYQDGRGKADAIKTGLRYVRTPYVVVMDGDYTYDPRDIKKMLEELGENDEVIGVRDKANMPRVNRFGNLVITWLFNLLFGTRLRDVCSGMYLLRTDVAREVSFESKGFSVEVEIAAHIASTGGRIGEVEISYRKRIGRSKLRKVHGLWIATTAVKLMLKYNPAFFFFLVSSLALVPGVVTIGYVAYKLLFYGVKHYVWALIGVTAGGVGLVSLLIAIFALYMKRFEYRVLRALRELRADRRR
ncbi:MAG: glycosyltransferase family 2 protein, partial [Sulfolobales archaeon]